ncbi:MAG: hypothetical protein ABSF45_16400 [Terriglobia bacterium]
MLKFSLSGVQGSKSHCFGLFREITRGRDNIQLLLEKLTPAHLHQDARTRNHGRSVHGEIRGGAGIDFLVSSASKL